MIEVSIIISTYNSPSWLQKVLYGYNNQTYQNFEILIADDGSGEETRKMVEKISKEVFYPIKHVWHEDAGFRKCVILNKAIMAASSEYIIMSDGDCIPRKDFVETHIKYRAKGFFLSGGYFKLPMSISQLISKEDIDSGRAFDVAWLKQNGLKPTFKNNKLTAGKLKTTILNKLTPTTPSWNGHNASGWKSDIVAINGFDERMQYGGEDREMGERLVNYGIKPKQIRYSAIVIHLDHERGYVKDEMIEKNKKIREITKSEKRKWTDFGIKKHSS